MPALAIIGVIAIGAFIGTLIRLASWAWKDAAGDWSPSGYPEPENDVCLVRWVEPDKANLDWSRANEKR